MKLQKIRSEQYFEDFAILEVTTRSLVWLEKNIFEIHLKKK